MYDFSNSLQLWKANFELVTASATYSINTLQTDFSIPKKESKTHAYCSDQRLTRRRTRVLINKPFAEEKPTNSESFMILKLFWKYLAKEH